jgi:hypothetical protein
MGILEKIKAGSNHYRETVWPGSEDSVLLRILNMQDYNNIFNEVDALFKDVTINMVNMDDYNSERENFMLFYSLTDSETKQPIFKNITEFRKLVTPEVRDILAEELDALHVEVSPNPYTVSDSEFDKLLHDLKKNSALTVGSVSNIYTLRKLVCYLADTSKK